MAVFFACAKADILSSIQPDDIIRVPERYF